MQHRSLSSPVLWRLCRSGGFILAWLIVAGCGKNSLPVTTADPNYILHPTSSPDLPPVTTVPVTTSSVSANPVAGTSLAATSTPSTSAVSEGVVQTPGLVGILTKDGVTPPSPSSTSVTGKPVLRQSPQISGCPIFPADNDWNKDISGLPVHQNSQIYIRSIGFNGYIHPDFGENITYGIPYNQVSETVKKVPVRFLYAAESDVGPYPLPPTPLIEYGDDKHLIVLDTKACLLYELYKARLVKGVWNAAAGAIFDLKSNVLRPDGWTSADAAGLPIFPGLVRYEEVMSGQINHALRFTAPNTQNAYIHPATHAAGSDNAALPPMGLRVRLKPEFDISGFSPTAQVLLTTMKKYGLILADNGSSWFVSGVSDRRWQDSILSELKKVPGSAFEAVDTGKVIR